MVPSLPTRHRSPCLARPNNSTSIPAWLFRPPKRSTYSTNSGDHCKSFYGGRENRGPGTQPKGSKSYAQLLPCAAQRRRTHASAYRRQERGSERAERGMRIISCLLQPRRAGGDVDNDTSGAQVRHISSAATWQTVDWPSWHQLIIRRCHASSDGDVTVVLAGVHGVSAQLLLNAQQLLWRGGSKDGRRVGGWAGM